MLMRRISNRRLAPSRLRDSRKAALYARGRPTEEI